MKLIKKLEPNTYVLATKYHDGDPNDHFVIGFLDREENGRYFVLDANGQQFRASGFRRASKISAERGSLLVLLFREIELSTRSVWWWKRLSIKTLAKIYNETKRS